MKNKKFFLLFITLLLFITVSSGNIFLNASDNEEQLVILHTNDTHGHPLKFDNYPMTDVGGLPARATLINNIRAEYDNVLVLDAGDINTGRPESNFFKAEPDIIGYNYIGYDAMAIGNHEFDNPLTILKKQMRQAKFPFLSANVTYKNGKYIGQPYIIKKFKGFTVAVLGLTTKETEIIGNPDIIKDIIIKDEVTVAKELVSQLKKQADIIIALVHLGIYDNDKEGSKRLAKEVDGIDIIIDGHTHTKLEAPIRINNTYIIQAWQWGLEVGKGILTIRDKQLADFNWTPVPVNLTNITKKDDGTKEITYIDKEIKEDGSLLAKLNPYNEEVQKILSQKIGYANSTYFNKMTRLQETAIGDIVSDSMAWFTDNLKVDFAIQNSGGIRTDLPEGDIKLQTIYEILPFDNSIVVITLKGSDVIEMFNYIATISQGKGAFPQVSKSVSFTINYDTGICEDILINGQPIDVNKEYKIATNSYLAAGGDGYTIFKNAISTYDTSLFQRDAFIDYIKFLNKKLDPQVVNRIKIIGAKTSLMPHFSKDLWVFIYNKRYVSILSN